MSRRPAAPPPDLPGYTVDRLLGSGGFADVYLFQQHLPQRPVAIKILTGEASVHAAQDFVAEANVMAQLSGHSAIVTIYDTGTARDGRPYIVMQYCPLPNLAQRIKQRPLPLAEALGIGVRLAGAVETAHRAGIVHRDSRPANILTTEYGRPALTDFGIAGHTEAGTDPSEGVSVPWAPPEALDGHAVGVRGDVYSLAATVYTMLAGRSPFYSQGGDNSRLAYITRIKRSAVPPLGRDDAPDSLVRALTVAMSKSPDQRPGTALDFARSLQSIEQELQLPLTDVEVPDTAWLQTPRGQSGGREEATVVRAATPVVQPPAHEQPTRERRAPAHAAAEALEPATATVHRAARELPASHDVSDTAPPAAAPGDDHDRVPSGPRPGRARARRWLVGSGAVALAAAGLISAELLRGELADVSNEPPPTIDTITLPEAVPAPTGLRGVRMEEGTAQFTWVEPANLGEVEYSWRLAAGAKDERATLIAEPPLEIADDNRVCIELRIVTANGRVSAEPAQACVD
ncbi:MAG TPA: serine/threonine-protein kinase [Actinomycetaceae bacterium]|nr:serine/threonine-protein kinase [Actinomycetaceae bacterium]